MTESIAFRNIDVCSGQLVLTGVAGELDASGSPNSGVLIDAKSVAEFALKMYQGLYPLYGPYLWWDGSIFLPWSSQYWTKSEEEKLEAMSFDPAELAKIVAELAETGPIPSNDILTFRSRSLMDSYQSAVQGLAVETMLCVDRCIDEVIAAQHGVAATWISAAYKHLMQAIIEMYERSRGGVSENARKAAAVRHREHQQFKNDVLAYYAEHRQEYRSIDEAAGAIAGKIVPVTFRTAQVWISAYLKSQRSASTHL